MKVLFIEHYFEQDMEALMFERNGIHEFRYISANYFALKARKFFPDVVFNGLEEYCKPKYRLARYKWSQKAFKLFRELYKVYPFDIVIAPSDSFFYIRDLVTASKKWKIPFIVAQKETTIAPGTMRTHSKEVGMFCPFISDYMTVCSERHKEFWLKSGASGNKIEVTGQPRFDFYKNQKKWLLLDQLGISLNPKLKTILFFTYELDAYSPDGQKIWEDLRTDTEKILADLAKNNLFNIIIKPHPQHNIEDIEFFSSRLQSLCGSVWKKSIFVADRKMDARQLIVNSDIVIAFQSTALLESLISGKRVIYTYWGEGQKIEKVKKFILPFYDYSKIMECVNSPSELKQALLQNSYLQMNKEILKERMDAFKEYLGPLDGKSSERTWQAIEKITDSYYILNKDWNKFHNSFRYGYRAYCIREIFIASITKLLWLFALSISKKIFKSNINHIITRTERQGKRIMECKNAIGKSSKQPEELVGHIDEEIMTFIKNKFHLSRKLG
ncbi:MAG: CDP-glycerol glycerophosphotransferase family protein [bacterium]|nr:CDP-glycerol glycerophosphotransferase family protein [bacterium]